jgi:hypothetical protein
MAALLGVALMLSGCSSGATPGTADPSVGSRFSNFFSGSASPQTPVAAAGPTFNPADCPTVDIRTGAGTLTLGANPAEKSPTDVRYQLSFSQWARQCTAVGSTLNIKVGVQGRIVVGPAGGPGPVDVPLRYAVVREGANPKTIVTRFKRIAAEVPPGETNVAFSDVEDDLSFPIPPSDELVAYILYVGFDSMGEAPEKKPAPKKPAPKRK